MRPALRQVTTVAASAAFGWMALAVATPTTAAADPAQGVAPPNDAVSVRPVASHAPAPPVDYSAASLYNSANALARQGRPGLAVLDYERARLIDPSDADVDANLRLVRRTAGVPTAARTLPDRVAALANPRWFYALGVLGVVLVGLGALARFVYPRHRIASRVALVVGVISIAGTALQAAALWPTLHGAVVLTRDTPVRVSPVPLSDPLFALPEAETVTLRAVHDEFLLVETRAGRTGWVSRANVEPIVPIR